MYTTKFKNNSTDYNYNSTDNVKVKKIDRYKLPINKTKF